MVLAAAAAAATGVRVAALTSSATKRSPTLAANKRPAWMAEDDEQEELEEELEKVKDLDSDKAKTEEGEEKNTQEINVRDDVMAAVASRRASVARAAWMVTPERRS